MSCRRRTLWPAGARGSAASSGWMSTRSGKPVPLRRRCDLEVRRVFVDSAPGLAARFESSGMLTGPCESPEPGEQPGSRDGARPSWTDPLTFAPPARVLASRSPVASGAAWPRAAACLTEPERRRKRENAGGFVGGERLGGGGEVPGCLFSLFHLASTNGCYCPLPSVPTCDALHV